MHSLLMERFPALGLSAYTWEPEPLPLSQVKLPDLGKANLLYIGGIAHFGLFFQLKKWLEDPNKKIVFLEDNPGYLASFLQLPEAEEILSHSQVLIEMGLSVDELAEKYRERRVERVGIPEAKKLKLFRRTTLSYALQMDRLYGHQPFENFVKNTQMLPKSFYANRLKDQFADVPAIICGAGPSLSIEVLKQMEDRALIIAGGSTIAALSSKGIIPHFGMVIDPNYEELLRMQKSSAADMPLLYSTRVYPRVFETSNGPFGYMRCGVGGAPELWLEEELGLKEPLIGDCLSPESISVTSICLAWAQFIGCKSIYLNGIDLAYTRNRRYAEGVTDEKEVPYDLIDQEKSVGDRILKRKGRKGTVHTAVRWIMEAASLSYFARKHKEIAFFNTTEEGLPIRGIPYAPLPTDLPLQKNLRKRVYEAIDAASMPPQTKEIVAEKMKALKESLARLIGYLEILAGKKKGSSALAEYELKEEIAYLYLFYDIRNVIREEPFWDKWLLLALQHQKMLP